MHKCTCKFIAPNEPLITSGCRIHTKPIYSCDLCACLAYRPTRAIVRYRSRPYNFPQTNWPICACGHEAQEHS